jgi:PAS domain-containing protein
LILTLEYIKEQDQQHTTLGKGCFRMNSAAAGKDNAGGWDDGSTQTSVQRATQATDLVPASSTRQYHLLAEVAANLSSGFLLLNRRERAVYVNPGALRLLQIGKSDLLEPQDFDVRQQLLSLVDPHLACAELDRAWSSPEQEASTDLALAHTAVHWLRVRCFPIRDNGGDILGCGVLCRGSIRHVHAHQVS